MVMMTRMHSDRPDQRARRGALAALLAVGIAPFYLNGFYNTPLLAAGAGWFWGVEVFTWIVMPAVLLGVGWRRGLYTWDELGVSMRVRGKRRPWVWVGLMAGVPVAFWWVDVDTVLWAHAHLPRGWATPAFRYVDVIPPPGPQTGWWRLLVLAHLCLTAGVVEELYYRAAMSRLFPRGWAGGAAYVVASSVIFAGSHFEGGLPNVAEAFVVGCFAAAVYRGTGNVWPLIVGHVVVDGYWFSG